MAKQEPQSLEELISEECSDRGVEIAARSYEAQVGLFETIAKTTEVPLATIAQRLGVEEEKAADYLQGCYDLTMTELRLLSIAAEVYVEYEVKTLEPSA